MDLSLKLNFRSNSKLSLLAVVSAKAHVTWDIFAQNIAIKRYCNKIIFLGHGCLYSIGQHKLLSKQNRRYIMFFKSLFWLVNRNLFLKIVKRYNIFLSQYCVQKCLVWRGPWTQIHKLFSKESKIIAIKRKNNALYFFLIIIISILFVDCEKNLPN